MRDEPPGLKNWPAGQGEMAERVRSLDWRTTALGPKSGWPASLACAVDLTLASGFPMIVLWGNDLIQIYNDGYRDLMGNKHPSGLGQRTRDSWPEVWSINEPIYERVWAGETLTFEDALYPITRSGQLIDAWFTLSYSPLRDGDKVSGVLVTVFETTRTHVASNAMRKSEERYRAFVTASSDVVYRMSPDWSQMRELDGRGLVADVRAPTEDWMDHYILPEDRGIIREAIDGAIRSKSLFELDHCMKRADGSPAWTHSRAVPILDDDGEIVEWLGSASDITERKEIEEALSESEKRQRFLLLLTDTLRPLTDGAAIEREATRLLGEHLQADRSFLSPVYEDGLGMYVREEYLRNGASSVLGDYTFAQFGDFVGPELHAGRMLAVDDVSALTGITPEQRASYAAVEIGAYLLIPLIRNGQLAAFFTINHRTARAWSDADKAIAFQAADRTWTAIERARAEESVHRSERHANTLLAELQHRVRNTLAVVRSIARRTAERTEDSAEFLSHFEGRLNAFSRVQAVVTRSAAGSVSLRSLVEDELLAIAAREGDHLRIEGPQICLKPRVAESMSLAIHELSTNAVKYGALAAPNGRVSVSWKNLDGDGTDKLAFEWREAGLETRPTASHEGFGHELLLRSLPYDLGAKTDITFEKDGLRFSMTVPLGPEVIVTEGSLPG